MIRGIVARAVAVYLVCAASAVVAQPIVTLEAVGDHDDAHEIVVASGSTVQLVYAISEAADLASFQNDMTFTGDFGSLSGTLAGTWWGAQDATTLTFNYNATDDYWRLFSYVDTPPPYSYSNAGESSLVIFELVANSGDIEIDLLSLAEAGNNPPDHLWVSADPDTGDFDDLIVDTANSLPTVTIHVSDVVYGASPASITVEDGPGTLPEKLDVDVTIENVQDLWVWDFDAYWTPGGPRVLAAGDVAHGGWWNQSYWPTVVTSSFVRVSGGPDEAGDPKMPVMQSGSGTLATLTLDYAGVATGTHGLEFRVAELASYDGTPPAGFLSILHAQVVDLEIIVEPALPPGTPAWETEPHATATDTIAMTATAVTDNHSPAEDIQYQSEIGGAPQGWQSNRDFMPGGLATNSEHVCRVQARDGVGNESDWSAPVAVYTFAADPIAGTPPLDDHQTASIRANWLHNGNPTATTTYQVGAWLGDTATGDPDHLYDSPGDDTLKTCDGLSTNTQYTFCVRAVNGDGLPTAWVPLGTDYTLAADPLAGAPPIDQHTTTSVRANWLHNGNPTATTTYQVGVWAGGTATGPPDTTIDAAGGDTSATIAGLGVNSQHTVCVRALNGDDVPTDWVLLGTTHTLAADPVAGTPPLDDHQTNSIRANWLHNGNPPATTSYQVGAWLGSSAVGAPDHLYDSPGDDHVAVCDGLSVNAQYTFCVRALNGDDVPTGWIPLGTAYTLAADPLAGVPPLDQHTTESIRANWLHNGNPTATTTYQVGVWAGGTATGDPDTSFDSPGDDTFKVCTALAINAQYTFCVRAVNGDATETDWVPLGTDYTLADVPGGGAVTAAGPNQVEADWTLGTNPAGTEFQSEIWTGTSFTGPGDALVEQKPWGPTLGATFANLSPNTLYSVRVRARSHNTALPVSDWTVLGSGGVYTSAVAPGRVVIDERSMIGGRLNGFGRASRTLGILRVELNGNPADTRIAVRIGDDAGDGWLRFGNAGQGEDERHLYANGTQPTPYTPAQLQNARIRGLAPDTLHEFHAQAFNGADDPTAIVEAGDASTTKDCDVNGSGVVTALDFAHIRAAMLRGDDFTDKWPCDPNDGDGIGQGDLDDTRNKILNP